MLYNVHELLEDAYAYKASDLHVTVNSPPLYRINGELTPYGTAPLTGADTEKMTKEILRTELEWEKFSQQGEIDISHVARNGTRFRLNIYKQQGEIGFAARVIPEVIPTIEELALPLVLKQLAEKPYGLVLVTGPTGSGKTTTLAAIVDYINRNFSKHIVTLEDPIEYVHEHRKSLVNQRGIGLDTVSFASGLRAALRQDPDIILVGEMRDLDTIATAITAAETGHLVLATLHTATAAQTIDRIIDVFPPHQQAQIRIQLAFVLAGIISQRLFVRSDGSGRIAATEVLVNHPSVANLIRNEKTYQLKNVIQTSRSLGMHTLESSIQNLLSSGMISMQEATPYLTNVGD